MAIKKVAFEFDPFKMVRVNVPRNRRKEALAEVQDFVKETALSNIGEGVSPVSGGRWKRSLTKGYRKRKISEFGSSVSDLELSGDLLDEVDVVQKRGNKLSYQVEGVQAPKADGNNRGTYGKKRTNLKNAREFIPRRGKTLNKEIRSGIREILLEFKD